MADRAKARSEAEFAAARAKAEAEHAAWWDEFVAGKSQSSLIEAEVAERCLRLSRAEAQCIRDNPYACACMGPPPSLLEIPGAPCYCLLTSMAVERVLQS
jgi:hypothetical protein